MSDWHDCPRRRRAENGGNRGATAGAGIGSALAGDFSGPQYAMSPLRLHAIVRRVRSEFLEMPGLRLTLPPASTLWGLDGSPCGAGIEALIQSAFRQPPACGPRPKSEG